MIRPILTLLRRRIVIDVDTQKDLFLAEGAACIRNHRRVLVNIRRVFAWARLKNIRVLSTTLTGSQDQAQDDFCIDGTAGHDKISYTLRNRHKFFGADGCTDLPRDVFKQYDQIILQKRCYDPFKEPRADRMLSELRVDEYIIVGAETEKAIKSTVLGLLTRKKKVTVLTDAIGYRDKSPAEIALRQMEAKGAKMIESKTLLGTSCLRLVGVCGCNRCRGKFLNEMSRTN